MSFISDEIAERRFRVPPDDPAAFLGPTGPRSEQADSPVDDDFKQGWQRWLASALRHEAAFGTPALFAPVFAGLGAIFWFDRAFDTSFVAWLAGLLLTLSVWRFIRPGPAGDLAARALALFCLGGCCAALQTSIADTTMLDSPVTTTLTGQVLAREIGSDGAWRYRLELTATEKPTIRRPPDIVSLIVRAKGDAAPIGATMRVRARLSPPSGPALPGLNDFAFEAFYSGTGAIGFAYGRPEIRPPEASAALSLRMMIEALRGEIGMRIRAVLTGDVAAFATALITDERRGLSPATTDALRQAGLAHVIAISGLNMALAAGIFFVGLRRLLALSVTLAHRFAIKKMAAAGAILAVSAYYLVSGFGVSSERSYLMMLAVLLAVVVEVRALTLRNVALAAWVVVLLHPSSLLGPGFQMSFSATLALVAGYHWVTLRRAASIENPTILPAWLVSAGQLFSGLFLTSLLGGFSTALFSMVHFNRIALFGLIANLIAMPVISIIVMPAALIMMLLMPFGLETVPLMVMGFGIDLVIAIAKWTTSLGGDITTGQWPAWVLPAYAGFFLIACLLQSRLSLIGLGGMALVFVLGLVSPSGEKPLLIVFEDAQLLGIPTSAGILVSAPRPPDFVTEQWQRALRIDRLVPAEMSGEKREGRPKRTLDADDEAQDLADMKTALHLGATERFICRRDRWCLIRHQKVTIIQVREPARLNNACKLAAIVIADARVTGTPCPAHVLLIDREALRRRGSLVIRFDQDKATSGGEGRGPPFQVSGAFDGINRAWTRHRLYDWRQNRFIEPVNDNDGSGPQDDPGS